MCISINTYAYYLHIPQWYDHHWSFHFHLPRRTSPLHFNPPFQANTWNPSYMPSGLRLAANQSSALRPQRVPEIFWLDENGPTNPKWWIMRFIRDHLQAVYPLVKERSNGKCTFWRCSIVTSVCQGIQATSDHETLTQCDDHRSSGSSGNSGPGDSKGWCMSQCRNEGRKVLKKTRLRSAYTTCKPFVSRLFRLRWNPSWDEGEEMGYATFTQLKGFASANPDDKTWPSVGCVSNPRTLQITSHTTWRLGW